MFMFVMFMFLEKNNFNSIQFKKKYELKINEGYIVVSPLMKIMKIMTIKIFFFVPFSEFAGIYPIK